MNEEIKRPEKITTQKENVGTWFKQRMATLTLMLSAIAFAFKEVLDFSKTEKTVFEILMALGLTYFFAVYIALSMRKLGKNNGKASGEYKAAKKYMAEAKKDIKDISYLTPVFCRIKNKQALQDIKERYIEENGLNLKLYRQGYYEKDEIKEKLAEEELQVIHNAKHIKIDMLTPVEILSEKTHKSKNNPNHMGKTEQQLDLESARNVMVTKALFPVITSTLAVSVVWSTNIIWGIIQTTIIMLMGVMQYLSGEEEVLTILRNRFIMKGDYLVEFLSLYQSSPQLFKEEEEMIKEILEEKKPEKIQDQQENLQITTELKTA